MHVIDSPGVVEMVGPDTRMDEGVNPLPVKCPHCTLPDLDFAASPYLLTRGFDAPVETAPAAMGNFLVRERVKSLLEQVVPGACTFVPTAERKLKKPTAWWLAVPTRVVDLPGGKDRSKDGRRCSRCGEPKLGHFFYEPVKGRPQEVRHPGLSKCDCRGLDVFKTKQWHAVDTLEDQYATALQYTPKGEQPPAWSSFGGKRGVNDPPAHPERWTRIHIDRDLFFSARLEQLFKAAKVKGQLVRSRTYDRVELSDEDRGWVAKQLEAVADVPPGGKRLAKTVKQTAARTKSTATQASGGVTKQRPGRGKANPGKPGASAWFRRFLTERKKNSAVKTKTEAAVEFTALEKRQKLALPSDYREFAAKFGGVSFEDVNGIKGFTVHVLPPKKLDFKRYRRDRWEEYGVESDVDGVMFAATDHGDVFVFDVSAASDGEPEYPVYWLDHEQNALEPFAETFAACIRRFAQGN